MLMKKLLKNIQTFTSFNKQMNLTSSVHNFDSFKSYDQTQLVLLNEPCILVDKNDNIIGEASKKDCHLVEKMNSSNNGMLHRAFSLFIFDSDKRILLQQRSLHKITFPNHWTNACCSHPLFLEKEKETSNDNIGIKNAAKRRVNYELGIPDSQIHLDSIHYLTRIRYKADNVPYDGIFAENEIDYVLFMIGDFSIKPNSNEVKSIRYFSEYELREFISEEEKKESGVQFTPWFKLICNNFLFKWWKSLDNIEAIKDHKQIYRF